MKNLILFFCFLFIAHLIPIRRLIGISLRSTFLIVILFFNLNIEDCLCQWEPDYRLTFSTLSSDFSYNNQKCIESNSSTVHVVWYDTRDLNCEIYYKRSTDNGYFWFPDVRLTNNAYYSLNPSIALSGSTIHVVWEDDRDLDWEIYYKNSTDGINWGTGTRLTQFAGYSTAPAIAVSGLFVHVAWQDYRDGNYEIYYKRSTDGGLTWGTDTRLTNNSNYSRRTSIALSGSIIHVVWDDNRNGNLEIYYKRSPDGGISWGADTRLTNNSSGSLQPKIAVSGSNIHVVWDDDRDGNFEIYYKRSPDGGINWGTDTRLTMQSSISAYSFVEVSGSNVHVVWEDERDGNKEIYYKKSTDHGTNWIPDFRLTNNTAESEFPSLAISGFSIHVVWQDKRHGNYCIYYKRNPTGNVGIINISSEVPDKFELGQNYPNPFNSMTNVKFKMLNAGIAKITVFDLLGREVATLVNEYLKSGTYEVKFDTRLGGSSNDLPSGVYFYQLKSRDFISTKKLVLLK